MSNYLEGLFCYSELKFASVILPFFSFVINRLLNLSCIQCMVLRLRHAEVNTMLSKEHPEGRQTGGAGIPMQWAEGCGLPEEGAQEKGICLDLGLQRTGPGAEPRNMRRRKPGDESGMQIKGTCNGATCCWWAAVRWIYG